MSRPPLRVRSVLPAAFLAFTALSLAGACSSTTPLGGMDSGPANFGDAPAPKPEAATPRDAPADTTVDATSDVGSDAPADVVTDAGLGEASVGSACSVGSQCGSGICAPFMDASFDAGPDGGDAGPCATAGVCLCQAPTCKDGVKNGNETGVDCGGSCPGCGVNVDCSTGTDCVSLECGQGFKGGPCAMSADAGVNGGCVCAVPTCGDGVKNQDETDVDCGGMTCPHCGTGKTCTIPTDCTSVVCSAAGGTNRCACPAGMVEASTSVQAAYCIDAYEVTYAQYLTFTNQAIPTSMQPAECAWNTTFIPTKNWPQSGPFVNNPVTNVDWCDALAYCAHTGGKHLCGSIANPATSAVEGAPVAYGDGVDGGKAPKNDPAVDEWYNACSAQGQDAYPYGVNYNPVVCNGADSPAQSVTGPVETPPGSAGFTVAIAADAGTLSCIFDTACNAPPNVLPTVAAMQLVSCHLLPANPTMGTAAACGVAFYESACIGGITNQLFDMSGNVAEWENSCSGTTSASDTCIVRGGAFDTTPGSTTLTCASSAAQPAVPRNTTANDIGFRCCL